MNICLIGDGLTSLALAKNLISKKIKVFIYYSKKKKIKLNTRTIAISKDNLNFLKSEIINLKSNILWNINEIEIYNEKSKNEKILNFKKKNEKIFSMIRYNEFYDLIEKNLKKNNLYKKILIDDKNFYKKILKEKKHQLVINCETNNEIYKNFFYKKFKKDYNSQAYTFIIKHKKIENTKAMQIFTKLGPIAFLPISNSETSIVFSKIDKNIILKKNEIINIINKYNIKYEIKNFGKLEKFKLEFSSPRSYYNNNLMSFGDSIHKIHPLAGQGFNMTLRDIKILSKIIQNRIDLGMELNSSIYEEFEKKTKHFNFIFSSGIDFIHEFFKLDNKYKNNYSTKFLKFIGKNKIFNKLIFKYADEGFIQ